MVAPHLCPSDEMLRCTELLKSMNYIEISCSMLSFKTPTQPPLTNKKKERKFVFVFNPEETSNKHTHI